MKRNKLINDLLAETAETPTKDSPTKIFIENILTGKETNTTRVVSAGMVGIFAVFTLV